MRDGDRPAVIAMMTELWPDFDGDYRDEEVVVWERDDGTLGGFASYALRPWAEGCASMPVPYLEGWWVAPELRRRGVGRALVAAIEAWARAHGHVELGSDALVDNHTSHAAHAALGFDEVERVVAYRKRLA